MNIDKLIETLISGECLGERDLKLICYRSPEIRTIDQIRTIDRKIEIPSEGAMCDLMWSDPEDIDYWSVDPRGAGYLFGAKVAKEFCRINDPMLFGASQKCFTLLFMKF